MHYLLELELISNVISLVFVSLLLLNYYPFLLTSSATDKPSLVRRLKEMLRERMVEKQLQRAPDPVTTEIVAGQGRYGRVRMPHKKYSRSETDTSASQVSFDITATAYICIR